MNEPATEKVRGMTSRMAPMFIVVFCFSLLLNAFLDYSNFKRNHTDIERSRFSVVIDDLKDTVEYALNLGVTINEFSQLQLMINNTRNNYPEIENISVVDINGVSIYDTDNRQVGKNINKPWLKKALHAKTQWYDSDEVSHTIGVPIVNSINIVSATLVISYSKKNLTDKMATVGNELARVTLVLMGIFSALIFFGLKWINKGFEKDFLCMRELIEEARELNGPKPENPPDTVLRGFLEDNRKTYASLVELEAELAGIEGKSK